jgi:hypothetical protein
MVLTAIHKSMTADEPISNSGITRDEIKANFPKDDAAASVHKWLDQFDINHDKRITLTGKRAFTL